MPAPLLDPLSATTRSVLVPALCDADRCADGLAVAAYPGFPPRLLVGGDGLEDLAAYRFRGGYTQGAERDDLIEAIAIAGLRGRGGAAFPTAVKLRTLRGQVAPKFLVANGDEGEPASVKDRWLMRKRPHLVLDGALRAAAAVEATRVFLYVSDFEAEKSLSRALSELGSTLVPVDIFKVDRSYVAGEETSVVRAISGGPAKPTDKPPRPFEVGVHGRPTLVSNVETLANIPFIATRGAQGYKSVGDHRLAHGSVLLTITGSVERPGLYEVPLGTKLGDVLERLAGLRPGLRGFLMGGFFAGLMNDRALDLELSYDALRAAGSGLGCGAVVAIGADDCPVAAAADVMAFFSRENARQCGACFNGTAAMSRAINQVSLGQIDDAGTHKLSQWSTSLRGKGACGTLDGAAQLAATLFREFPDELDRHRQAPCPTCRSLPLPSGPTRFVAQAMPLQCEGTDVR